MRADLYSRLENWKFASARNVLKRDEPPETYDLVCALAETFGNCGWIEGNMSTIIDAALASIMPSERPKQED